MESPGQPAEFTRASPIPVDFDTAPISPRSDSGSPESDDEVPNHDSDAGSPAKDESIYSGPSTLRSASPMPDDYEVLYQPHSPAASESSASDTQWDVMDPDLVDKGPTTGVDENGFSYSFPEFEAHFRGPLRSTTGETLDFGPEVSFPQSLEIRESSTPGDWPSCT